PCVVRCALELHGCEWLSGVRPCSGAYAFPFAMHQVSASPPPLRQHVPAVAADVEHVVLKALAKDPQQRFARVQDFAMALEEAFNTKSTGRMLFAPASEHQAESGYSEPAMRNLPTGTVTLLFTDIEGSTHLLQQL